MTAAYVDTNVFIRFFVNDDPDRHARATALFRQVRDGQLRLIAPHTVIDEVVFVLSSRRRYQLPRKEIVALLTPLHRLRHVQVYQRDGILRALAFYADSALDFADCVLAALARQGNVKCLYSFDTDFDGIDDVVRLEP